MIAKDSATTQNLLPLCAITFAFEVLFSPSVAGIIEAMTEHGKKTEVKTELGESSCILATSWWKHRKILH